MDALERRRHVGPGLKGMSGARPVPIGHGTETTVGFSSSESAQIPVGEQEAKIRDRISRMDNRYKVTFYDKSHDMRRSIEVRGTSPMEAAEAGLTWMLDHQIWRVLGFC
jgi:hypothetical protein